MATNDTTTTPKGDQRCTLAISRALHAQVLDAQVAYAAHIGRRANIPMTILAAIDALKRELAVKAHPRKVRRA